MKFHFLRFSEKVLVFYVDSDNWRSLVMRFWFDFSVKNVDYPLIQTVKSYFWNQPLCPE